MTNAIRVRNLGKKYKICNAHVQYKNVTEMAGRILKMPYNYVRRIMNGERSTKESTFWALDDINFDLEQGSVLGIMGRNGSGKSTLLKIISRIAEPTTGRIEAIGRIGSLLGVGTGFHPELTGRENIILNGIILGMSRIEIGKKFDEIVDFSGVETFIEMPVKHYSSGMFMRLAFSVAAHLEPEILIVDEVLAVGDSDFQKKCLKKMRSYHELGHTILFVSHDLNAVRSLTEKALLLHHGKQVAFGDTESVSNLYVEHYANANGNGHAHPEAREETPAHGFNVSNFKVEPYECENFCSGGRLKFSFEYDFDREIENPKIALAINTTDRYNSCGLLADSNELGIDKLPPSGKVVCVSDKLFFTEGNCTIQLSVLEKNEAIFLDRKIANIYNKRNTEIVYSPRDWFDFCVKCKWGLEH
ncbi:MAG: ATP-binding cassette domain-containing protein [Lentisphaerae bacterium]|nr:ATP-binding cassette domain-containing protein [Lentisphaerota bacterium]MCP4100094.1 ATP-binding cassette domain-containing protein [Lentisphaerota bacterium]